MPHGTVRFIILFQHDLYVVHRKETELRTEARVAFSSGRGGVEMPEECNNITYDYIMLFKCVTYFTNSI